MKFLKLFILIPLVCSCNKFSIHDFKMGHHKVRTDGRVHPNYELKRQNVFISPMNNKIDIRNPQFKLFANYVYVALEERGHKRVYNPRKADLIILLEYKRTGPHRIQRTAVNNFWTNHSPFVTSLFLGSKNDTDASYEFLKKRRDIKDWKKEKDTFNHEYNVFLTRVRLRAIEYVKDAEPRIAWENKITVLGQKKRYASGFIAAIAASYKNWELDLENSLYSDLKHSDSRILGLYEKVLSENAYQVAEKKQRFKEDYRTLNNEELLKYYVRRKKKMNFNPLYEPERGETYPLIDKPKKSSQRRNNNDDGYFFN